MKEELRKLEAQIRACFKTCDVILNNQLALIQEIKKQAGITEPRKEDNIISVPASVWRNRKQV